MIRLTYLLRRKPGLSRGDFQAHWRAVHGPLVAGHVEHLDLLRHVQVHTLGDEDGGARSRARGEMEPPYDGVIEIWWESIETLERAMASDEGQRAATELLEAERDFVDLPASPLWFNYEYPQVNPTPENLVARERSTIVKSFYPLRARPELSDDEAQLYWRTRHGPLIRRGAWGRLLRYVQVHRVPHPLEETLREARGTTVEPYLGHAESWRDRTTASVVTPESQAFSESAVEDERKFIDFSRSSMWFSKEHVVVDRR